MRIWSIAIISVVVGVGAGLASVWSEFYGHPNQFEPHNRPRLGTAGQEEEEAKPHPRAVVVGGATYDFGKGQRDSKMKHTFVIRNEGDGPLTLDEGETSCKCTLSEVQADSIAPGQQADVTVEWTLATEGDDFGQTAEIITNDPEHPTVVLKVQGNVVDLVKLVPRELVLGHVPVGEGTQEEIRVYAFMHDELHVLHHEFTNQEIADYFELTFDSLDAAALAEQPDAKSGVLGRLTIKPGLPLGPINQTILLETNVEEVSGLELSVKGETVSDIGIIGPGIYNDEKNVIRFGTVAAADGAEATLRVLVKGPYRHDVRLSVKMIDPQEVLAVQLGTATKLNDGAVYMYPVRIQIPKGSRPINRLGSQQGKLGKIVIATTHPVVKELNIYVKFAVK